VVRCGSLILRSLTRNPKMGTDDSPHVCTQFSRGTWTRSVGTINRSSHFTSRAENDGRMTENVSQRNEGRVHALGRQTLDGSFHSSRRSVFARVYSRASPLRDMFKTHTRRVTKASESEVFTNALRKSLDHPVPPYYNGRKQSRANRQEYRERPRRPMLLRASSLYRRV